ncbi:tRNA (adenosine(37)-N6)-threonylcarbamoyltransferase complex dimerization subunit type 1 TsaB [Alphaproteobacteria bacterium]|nr:tRNA (adenosine(37)-N6)-threonylcarbamoyltransferase complex dimerization subunit type 1 TsaB [Alphaproteobacteria bacterium]
MPCLLGIETSGNFCSVAIGAEDIILSKKTIEMPYGQAGYLMGLLEGVLRAAQMNWRDISGIAVNRGPGSFTGIRVGLSVVQGLSLAGGIPIWGLTGFEVYRSLMPKNQDLLVLIDTRRDDYFSAFFQGGEKYPRFSKIMTATEVESFCHLNKTLKVISNIKDVKFNQKFQFFSLEADSIVRAIPFYQDKGQHIFSSDPYYLREAAVHGKSKAF